jgi:hypothetical protein
MMLKPKFTSEAAHVDFIENGTFVQVFLCLDLFLLIIILSVLPSLPSLL